MGTRRSYPTPIVGLLLAAAAIVSAGPPARAAVCAATEICAAENSTCTIGTAFEIRAGCVLDFATRPVTLIGTLRSELPGQGFTIRAPALTLDGGDLLATGGSGGNGGAIVVEIPGPFRMLGSNPQVSVDSGALKGAITITAGSIDIVSGTVSANGTDGGPAIALEATGVLVVAGTTRSLGTGSSDATGGEVEITGGSVEIRNRVDVSGRTGGAGDVTVTATSGTIRLTGAAQIVANAQASKDEAGSGGAVVLAATDAVTVDGTIQADGPAPDGSAGTIEIASDTGDIRIGAGAAVLLRGLGNESDGGTVVLGAASRIDVATNGLLDVSAGPGDDDGTPAGGTIDLRVSGAPGSITIAATAELRARNDGGVYTESPGALLVLGTIDATGESGNAGGEIALGPHCAIGIQGTLDSSGPIDPTSPRNRLTAQTITISGNVRALPCGLQAPESCNVLTVRTRTPTNPNTGGAVVSPAPQIVENPLLSACCGNGVLDSPLEHCDDGNRLFCDACSPTCTLVPLDVCVSDGDPCTGPGCHPKTGCLPATGPACAGDGDPCTDDVCRDGRCTHDSPCDPENMPPCKTGMCQAGVGCVFEDLPDGTSCAGAVCSVNVCQAGECVTAGPLDCDDADPCTSDRCDTGYGGCVNVEIPGGCPCMVGGLPLAQNTPCADGDNCTESDRCDEAGTCVPGPGCADADPCTTDVCISPGDVGCFHVEFGSCPWSCAGRPDGSFCADRDGCSVGTCQSGACTSEQIACTEPDETCRPLIQPGSSAGCRYTPFPTICPDDGNPCTSERFDPALGCVHDPLSGAACPDDGKLCTQDVCENGTATHPPRICDDGVACTADACDPAAGCVFMANDALCDDGDACTVDRCVAGTGCTHTGSCALDHFACYETASAPGAAVAGVELIDAFFTSTVTVLRPGSLCAPASQSGNDPTAPAHPDHLVTFKTARTSPGAFVRRRGIRVRNDLGTLTLDVVKPERVAVPAATSLTDSPPLPTPPDPDHFQCYKVARASGAPRFVPRLDVPLADRFQTVRVEVRKPLRLCMPVSSNGNDPSAPKHAGVLLCYQVKAVKGSPTFAPVSPIFVNDQLGQRTAKVARLRELCLVSSLETS
jgi:cysteine-rich repeat protein